MSAIIGEIVGILLLLLANGFFAMTEIAVNSACKARLKRLADAGDDRARRALDLAESPNRFLATVQIGITLVGILAPCCLSAGHASDSSACQADSVRPIVWVN